MRWISGRCGAPNRYRRRTSGDGRHGSHMENKGIHPRSGGFSRRLIDPRWCSGRTLDNNRLQKRRFGQPAMCGYVPLTHDEIFGERVALTPPLCERRRTDVDVGEAVRGTPPVAQRRLVPHLGTGQFIRDTSAGAEFRSVDSPSAVGSRPLRFRCVPPRLKSFSAGTARGRGDRDG